MKKLEETKPVIVGGDLNVAPEEIDICPAFIDKEYIPGFSSQERESFGDFLTNSGFVDTFRHFYPEQIMYTVWSVKKNLRPVNKGMRIDFFLASAKAMSYVQASQIHNEIYGSDHCPVSV